MTAGLDMTYAAMARRESDVTTNADAAFQRWQDDQYDVRRDRTAMGLECDGKGELKRRV